MIRFQKAKEAKQTSLDTESILAGLRADLKTAEGKLESEKASRAKIAFDGGDREAAAKKIKNLEEHIDELKQSIKEGVTRLRLQRAAEATAEAGPLWEKMRRDYLRCHELAKQIESICSDIEEAEQRFNIASSMLKSLDLPYPSRVKSVAIRKYKEEVVNWAAMGAVERRLMSEEIAAFTQHDQFPAGRGYSQTDVARVMELIARLTITGELPAASEIAVAAAPEVAVQAAAGDENQR